MQQSKEEINRREILKINNREGGKMSDVSRSWSACLSYLIKSRWNVFNQLHSHHESHFRTRRTFPFVDDRSHPFFFSCSTVLNVIRCLLLRLLLLLPRFFSPTHTCIRRHPYCVQHNHLFVIYIHAYTSIYVEHTYTQEINNHGASKEMELPLLFQHYV